MLCGHAHNKKAPAEAGASERGVTASAPAPEAQGARGGRDGIDGPRAGGRGAGACLLLPSPADHSVLMIYRIYGSHD